MKAKPPMAAGQRYGKLVAIRPLVLGRNSRWQFRCDCGNVVSIFARSVRHNKTRSCGCYFREATSKRMFKHGRRGTPEYKAWNSMLQRCENSKNPRYERYGGRGIRVCEQWHDFETFYADMGPRPFPNHSIDRINNDKGYEPDNCRWTTPEQQRRNKVNTRIVIFQGRALCITDACKLAGISYPGFLYRVALGWSDNRALSVPPRSKHRKLHAS